MFAARWTLLAVCWLADELLAEGEDLLRMLLRCCRAACCLHAAVLHWATALCLAARVRAQLSVLRSKG